MESENQESDREEEKVELESQSDCRNLVLSLNNLRRNGLFCDAMLVCRADPAESYALELSVHSCVLAAASACLHGLLQLCAGKEGGEGGGGGVRKPLAVELEGYDLEVIMACLDHVYAHTARLCTGKLAQLRRLAAHLQLSALQRQCTAIMQERDLPDLDPDHTGKVSIRSSDGNKYYLPLGVKPTKLTPAARSKNTDVLTKSSGVEEKSSGKAEASQQKPATQASRTADPKTQTTSAPKASSNSSNETGAGVKKKKKRVTRNIILLMPIAAALAEKHAAAALLADKQVAATAAKEGSSASTDITPASTSATARPPAHNDVTYNDHFITVNDQLFTGKSLNKSQVTLINRGGLDGEYRTVEKRRHGDIDLTDARVKLLRPVGSRTSLPNVSINSNALDDASFSFVSDGNVARPTSAAAVSFPTSEINLDVSSIKSRKKNRISISSSFVKKESILHDPRIVNAVCYFHRDCEEDAPASIEEYDYDKCRARLDVFPMVCRRCLCDYPCMVELVDHECPAKDITDPAWCFPCDKSLGTEKSLRNHLVCIHNLARTVRCPACGTVLSRPIALERHKQQQCRPSQDNWCDHCNRFLPDLQSHRKHLEKTSLPNAPRITGRRMSMKRVYAANREYKRTWRNRSFTCKLCNQTFDGYNRLYVHQVTVHERKYACPYCDKAFQSNVVLQAHIASHENRRDFLCTKCAFSTTSELLLQQHERRVHDDSDVAYRCPVCTYGAPTEQRLAEHHRQEHGADLALPVTPNTPATTTAASAKAKATLLCNVCGKVYHDKGNLNVHMKTHKWGKCKLCKFEGKALNLEGHYRRMHNKNRMCFVCNHCGSRQALKSKLLKHLQKVHGIRTPPNGLKKATYEERLELATHFHKARMYPEGGEGERGGGEQDEEERGEGEPEEQSGDTQDSSQSVVIKQEPASSHGYGAVTQSHSGATYRPDTVQQAYTAATHHTGQGAVVMDQSAVVMDQSAVSMYQSAVAMEQEQAVHSLMQSGQGDVSNEVVVETVTIGNQVHVLPAGSRQQQMMIEITDPNLFAFEISDFNDTDVPANVQYIQYS